MLGHGSGPRMGHGRDGYLAVDRVELGPLTRDDAGPLELARMGLRLGSNRGQRAFILIAVA